MVYLDNAATTRPHAEILDSLVDIFANDFGNPSSVHPKGIKAAKIISDSRKSLSKIFKVPQAGIIFCSSGTESDNLAIKGSLDLKKHSGKHIITTRIEHAAVIRTCEWLQEKHDINIDFVNIDKQTGLIDLEHLADLIGQNTLLVSIQHANSETGVIQDLAAISRVIKSKHPEVVFHSDGVQAFARVPFDFPALGVDLYSISAHKFHGIKGAGALVLSQNLNLQPIVHGGGQEHGLRSGTENVAAIAAMGKAAEIAYRNLDENLQKVTGFSTLIKTAIQSNFPECRLFEAPGALPHIISLSIPGILGEVLLHHLAEHGIYISTGSACNAASKKLSPVLTGLGFSRERIMQTVRISIAAGEIPDNQEAFAGRFVKIIKELKDSL